LKACVIVIALLSFIVYFSSCQKGLDYFNTVITDSTTTDSTITDTTYFIEFTLNGKRVFQIAGNEKDWTNSWYILGDTSIYPYSSLQTELDYSWQPSIFGFYFSKNGYGLNVGAYSSYDWWTPLVKTTFIDSFFRAGNYSYAKLTGRDTTYTSILNPDADRPRTQQLLGDGIHLIWFDSTGKVWQTCSGIADQTGSYFTITKNEFAPFDFFPGYSDYTEKTSVSAKFDCNLYNGEGNVLHLTNGRFRLLLKFKQFN
jgi:hypothetical protein